MDSSVIRLGLHVNEVPCSVSGCKRISRSVSNGALARVEHHEGQSILLDVRLSKVKGSAIADTGATDCVVSDAFLSRTGLTAVQATRPLTVAVAGDTEMTLTKVIKAPVQVGTVRTTVTMYVMPTLLKGIDMILGMDWLTQHDAHVHTKTSKITLTVKGKQHVVAGRSHRAGLTVAALQALHADPKFITAKQAHKAMKQGCNGWLFVVQDAPKARGGLDEITTDLGTDFDDELRSLLKSKESVFASPAGLPTNVAMHPVIPMYQGSPATYSKPYRLSPLEEQEVDRQIADLLAKGFIEPSCSPYGSPVLFVQKKDGTLRMCIDYRQLNKYTVPDRYPIPRIDALLDKVGQNRVFTSLDLQSGYHQMLLHESDVPKTAFVTHKGQYQFKVLCFGLTNAPSAFQRLMNHLLHDFIQENIVQVYLDDILVMSKTPQEHLLHLSRVLERLQEKGLHVKLSKCDWAKTELKFLGHVIGNGTVRPDSDKIKIIKEWPLPTCLKGMQRFLGMVNFFAKNTKKLAVLAAPLSDLTQPAKAKAYNWNAWGEKELKAFELVKEALCSDDVVLHLPDLNAQFTLHTDASGVGCGATLLQDDKVVAYYSHKFTPAEQRYHVYDQEALSLYLALSKWRCYLEGAKHAVCLTDHRPLEHLMTQPSLSRKQAGWLQFMSRFKLTIKYIKGVTNVVADAISRFPGWVAAVRTRRMVCKDGLHQEGSVEQARCMPRNLPLRGEEDPTDGANNNTDNTDHIADVSAGTSTDGLHHALDESLAQTLVTAYQNDINFADAEFTNGFVRDEQGIYTWNGKVVVPQDNALRTRVIKEMHDIPMAGHRGVRKTQELVGRQFWWPTLRQDVAEYVSTCDLCQRMKSCNQKRAGLLQPLPIAKGPWTSVSMDLITGLPKSRGYDSVLVFVDRLTKYVILVPTVATLDAAGFAELFVDNVISYHGVPDEVVSDRGPQFNNVFWSSVSALLGMKNCLSTAYHPESDGQTERTNRILEDVLRHFVSPDQLDWSKYLKQAQFAINNSWQEAVKYTPYYLNHGRHPKMPSMQGIRHGPSRVPAAEVLVRSIQDAIQQAKKHLKAAQDRMQTYVNQRRKDVVYTDGDMVMLSTVNLRTREGSRKLMPKWVGPFEVREMVGKVAVRLHLSAGYERLHNVFHVSLLKPYKAREGEVAQAKPLPWLVDDDGQPQWEVQCILDHQTKQVTKGKGVHKRKVPNRFQITAYLVKWVGFESPTWEPAENLVSCAELLAAYKESAGLLPPKYV